MMYDLCKPLKIAFEYNKQALAKLYNSNKKQNLKNTITLK